MNQPVIDVVLSPAEIDLLPQRDLGGAVAVVFDVLRATSTMITALSHGASDVRPVRTIEEALALKATLPAARLGGERHGERIEGFDLGNSPLEYAENVRGREIITTTTNGTVALRAVEGAATVLAAAILNMEATAERVKKLTRLAAGEIVIVCAGTFREAALEDILAAGMLVSLLPECALTDGAEVARALYRQEEWDLHSALRRAKNGRALIAKGREAEVEWCSRASVLPLVAQMGRDGIVRQAVPRA